MQRDDSSTYSATMNMNPNIHEQEHLKCPRCESFNTKFCYYNNYNLSQPRHFCKSCRRYWTKGGTLRNIPIGGGSRKNTKRTSNSNKRGVSSSSSFTSPVVTPPPAEQKTEGSEIYGDGNGGCGSFRSLLGSTPGGQFAKLLMDGLNPDVIGGSSEDGLIRNPNIEEFESSFLSVKWKPHNPSESGGGESSCYSQGVDGWPHLSIYTPGPPTFGFLTHAQEWWRKTSSPPIGKNALELSRHEQPPKTIIWSAITVIN
ncbi:hypothetical protein L1987_22757 [Smallanthus sonchifolius]|uniref:Uncharacterized protein n=1 Tax=Smallanthus sonchifolius TaxID=185202 RepID=A0ACB9IFK4_9ASTR|nr:hypothetical protein L1987_22757 [Smallanthus sonchifolius]